MRLTASQRRQFLNGTAGNRIRDGTDRTGDKQFVRMHAGIMISEMFNLQMLDLFNDAGSDDAKLLVDSGKGFQRIHQTGGSGTQ